MRISWYSPALNITFYFFSVYQVAGNVMVILTVLEKKTKKVAMRQNVKIGNLIVDKVNVFSNHGNATEKKTVQLELMKIIAQTSHLMRIVKRMGILTCPIFQIPLSAMNGRQTHTECKDGQRDRHKEW